MASSPKPLLLLIDGHSLAFRSYYAFTKGGDGGLSTKEGVPTSVTYGFLKALIDNCKGLKPDGLVVAFDTAEPTFRHEADAAYKAHRDEAPEAFFQDLANLQQILAESLDIPLAMAPGYEADDVLGTLANRAAGEGWRVRILSGDRDLFQLVDDTRDIAVLYMGGGPYTKNSGPTEIRREGVIAKLGVPPEEVVDLKALTGDSSDNIPGVRGVGPKTAINLLAAYEHVDGIYAALEQLEQQKQAGAKAKDPKGVLKGALLQKLRDDKDNAYRSRMLAEILVDIPLPAEPRLELGSVNPEALAASLQELELYSLAKQVATFAQLFSATPPQPSESPSPAGGAAVTAAAESLSAAASAPAADARAADARAAGGPAADAPAADASPGSQLTPQLQPELITTPAALEALVARLLAATDPAAPIALDTETTALNPFKAELVGIGLAWGEGPADLAYIPIGHQFGPASDHTSSNAETHIDASATSNLQGELSVEMLSAETCTKGQNAAELPNPPSQQLAEPGPTEAGPTQPDPTKPTPTQPAPKESAPTEPTPTEPTSAAPQQLPLDAVLTALAPWLASATHPKTLQNAKYDRLILLRHGLALEGVVMDTLLADYLRDANAKHGLEELAERNLGFRPTSYGELVAKGATFASVPIQAAAQYCGMDVHLTWRLTPLLRAQLAALGPKLPALLEQLELPLEPVLAAMEATGIRIDTAYLGELSEELKTTLERLETEAKQAAGVDFNLASPKQLGELLFDTLGLDRKKSRRTKTGWSTDAAVLEKLEADHPVVALVLEHRTLSKLKSTYVDALPALVEPETGRVHTDFNQAVTATGRLSSSNPNLQNIPVRTEFSRRIRQAFLPQEGWRLISADYSQIELRILAHLCGEDALVEAYRSGDDVHALTARLLLDKTPGDSVTPDERRLGKTINFGVVYGMGAQRFARETGVSQAEAKEFLSRYKQRYPKVFAFLELQERLALSQGYVETILGRRRPFAFDPGGLGRLLGKDPLEIDLETARRGGMEAQQLRAAANAPIQGSSADIIKLAMVQLHRRLGESGLPARLLLQVHDELVLEAAPDVLEQVVNLTRDTMEHAVALSVPLVVETGVGANWMDAK